jgi:hypothetical protein
MLARIRHRMAQFFGALRPRVSDEDRAEACQYLDRPLQAIFESMTLRDQQHGIAVYQRVREACSEQDQILFAASLLHDCGKGQVRLWHRVAYVLVAAGSPWLLLRIVSPDGAAWRQALWRLHYHPRLGAELVEAAGGHADVVRMIREQDAVTADVRLALLQAADEA